MESYNPFDNDKFRKELSTMLDDKLRPIVAEAKETREKVDEHEKVINQNKGAIWVARGLYGFLLIAFEYVFHRKG